MTPSSHAKSAAIALLAVLLACDPGGTPPNGDSGGSTTVFEPSDVHALGTSDVLALVEDLEVLPDGTVWVLNSVEPLLIAFDADGGLQAAQGRLGGGPEEFGAPAGFVEGGIGGGAWLLDYQRHALREVLAREGPARSLPLPRETLPPGSVSGTNPFRGRARTARVGEEVLVPRRAGDLDTPVAGIWRSMWSADLVAVAMDANGSVAREVLSLGAVLGDPAGHFSVEGSGLPFPFWYRLWTVCGGDELRVYDRLRNEVRRFTPAGVEIGANPLPPVSLTDVSARQFARAMFDLATVARMGEVPSGGIQVSAADSSEILSAFEAGLTASGSELANLLPRYVDLHCDSEGTQWVQPFDIDSPGPTFGGLRGGRLWLRTTAGGATDRFRMPTRFDPYRFTPRRIWGVQRDELDVATVAWIDLP